MLWLKKHHAVIENRRFLHEKPLFSARKTPFSDRKNAVFLKITIHERSKDSLPSSNYSVHHRNLSLSKKGNNRYMCHLSPHIFIYLLFTTWKLNHFIHIRSSFALVTILQFTVICHHWYLNCLLSMSYHGDRWVTDDFCCHRHRHPKVSVSTMAYCVVQINCLPLPRFKKTLFLCGLSPVSKSSVTITKK